MHSKDVAVFLLLAVALTGCAARKYRAAPISPEATAAAFEQRSLGSPALHDYITKTLGHEPSQWDLSALTLAAWHFNPGMDMARARVAEADAAIVTAGARPNPTVNAGLGGETSPESPWLAVLGMNFPLETAGKRGQRVSRAEATADAARWNLAATAWQVRSQVRGALLEYFAANRRGELLRNEEAIRAEQMKLLQQRLRVGVLSEPEVATARIQHAQAVMALRAAEGRGSQSLAALAAAIGIPVRALEGIKLDFGTFESAPPMTSVSPTKIKEDAVLNRIDVRHSLAAYAAAESALRLEIAKQYPDIELGPGYEFNEGNHGFSLGFAVTLPVLNRNQGPIAEAESARKEAAAQFLSVQAAGVGASEQALAKYIGALNEVAQARQIKQQSLQQEWAAEAAFKTGESDRVALNAAQLEAAIAVTAEQDAVYRAQQALGELEDAVQRPLGVHDLAPLTPQSPALRERERKQQ